MNHPPATAVSRALAPTRRALFRTLLCAVASVVVLALLPGARAGAVPAIEGFPNYHPQTSCSPKPKPGTVMLADYLMRRYPGSGSLGISRSCAASGVSEHKEGRAFDWALDATSPRDRRYARDFLHRIRKTDNAGHKDALARRMGIMYVIWDDHIYSATYHYQKRAYLNAGCKNLKHCSVSLRHRNHMHISITRAAAQEKTSWYEKRLGHKVTLAHPGTHKPAHPVTNTGTHSAIHKSGHKKAHKKAHRATHRHRRHHQWAHHRHHWRHHHRHGGYWTKPDTWQASQSGTQQSSGQWTGDHGSWDHDGHRSWQHEWSNNQDSAEDGVVDVGDHPWVGVADRFEVSGDSADGTVSTMRVRAGDEVKVLVLGALWSGERGVDAACVATSRGWVPRDPAKGGPELLVNGERVTWQPAGQDGGCSRYHAYVATFTATANGPLTVGVSDDDYSDNHGGFAVMLFRAGGSTGSTGSAG